MIKTLKQLVVKAIGRDAANRIHASLKRDPKFAGYAIRRLLQRRPKAMWTQSVPSFESKIALSIESLEDHFSKHEMCTHTGGHAIYVHRPEDIETLCPDLPARYPAPFGLKIFKSQSLSPDGTVYYTSIKTGTYTTPLAMWSVGSARDKLSVGNLLSLRGITPKAHDLIWLTHPGSTDRMAMVVEHVGHDIVCGDEGLRFMDSFKRAMQEEGVVAVGKSLERSVDFLPPDFNDNIIRGENGPLYVDIQTFVFRHPQRTLDSLTNGSEAPTINSDGRPLEKGHSPDRSISWTGSDGRGDMLLRSSKTESILRAVGCVLEGARVLDVGCHLGQFLAFFLSKGAAFCIGLDNPQMVKLARKYLYFYGFSRFELMETDLDDFESPGENVLGHPIDILLMTATGKRDAFPAWMEQANWKFLVFEGDESETLEHAASAIKKKIPDAVVAAEEVFHYGGGVPRPVIVLRRD